MFPGLGTATAIFGTYMFAEAFYERAFAKKPEHSHGHMESKAHSVAEES